MGDNRGSPWPERDEELRALVFTEEHGKRLGPAEIARRMKLSRGTIAGRINRLDLPKLDGGKRNTQHAHVVGRWFDPAVPKAQPLPAPDEPGTKYVRTSAYEKPAKVRIATGKPPAQRPAPNPAWKPRIFGGEPTCMWPIGDVGTPEFHYCGAPGAPGLPYCEAHHKLGTTGHRARERSARMGEDAR